MKIGIQLEHEEINWNTELQNQKVEGKMRSKQRRKKQTPANSACEFLQPANFSIILVDFCCFFLFLPKLSLCNSFLLLTIW